MKGARDLAIGLPQGDADAVASAQRSLFEAVEATDAEAPGAATHTVTVGLDAGTEATAADGLVVEEGHVEDGLVGV